MQVSLREHERTDSWITELKERFERSIGSGLKL